MPQKFERPVYYIPTAVLILFIAFIARSIQLDGVSLWYDETYTQVIVKQAHVGKTFDLLVEDAVHPPLYFLLMRFFPTTTDFALRLPTVLMGVISVALLMHIIIRLYANPQLALWAGLLLAINPYTIWHSRTARPYGMVLLLGLIVSYYFLLLLQGKRSWQNWALFTLFSAAIYNTHYYTAGMAFAQYITMMFVLRGDRYFFWKWVIVQTIAIIPLFGWLYAISQQEAIAIGIGWIPNLSIKDIGLTFWNLTIGYEGSRHSYEIIGIVAGSIGAMAGAYMAFRRYRSNAASLYFFWLFVGPVVGVFILSILLRPLYVDRYFIYVTPGLMILIVEGWWQLSRSKAIYTTLSIIFLAVCVLNIGSVLSNKDHERENWRDATAFILQNREPDDQIVSTTLLSLVPMSVYSHGETIDLEVLDEDFVESDESTSSSIWVVYKDNRADIHKQGHLDEIDVLSLDNGYMVQWLRDNEDRIISFHNFTGITVVQVKADDPSGAQEDIDN